MILNNHGGSLELKTRKLGLSKQEIFQEAAEHPHPKPGILKTLSLANVELRFLICKAQLHRIYYSSRFFLLLSVITTHSW